MLSFFAEFIGTALLVLLGNGVVANVVLPNTKGSGSGWIVITFGWGMAVFVAVWCVEPISGAHINPAVTIGLAVAGKFSWTQVPGFVAMKRYAALPHESTHAGAEPWQYMVCYEFDSEESLQAFVRSDTLRAMTTDYNARFGGAGERARFAYRQIYP